MQAAFEVHEPWSPGSEIGPYKLLEKNWRRRFGRRLHGRTEGAHSAAGRNQIDQAGNDSREVIARFEAERQAMALMARGYPTPR